ncbi:hypothetical protein [Streptomyces fractus]|uniref:hypothetical protein n=1 Tax=Streptomyces fractus TaxID=641806 RepID=UPI003CE7D211
MTETIKSSAPPRHPVRQLMAASVGNAVEWYDWYTYILLTRVHRGATAVQRLHR